MHDVVPAHFETGGLSMICQLPIMARAPHIHLMSNTLKIRIPHVATVYHGLGQVFQLAKIQIGSRLFG
jgi:hypothetical protein